MHPKDRVTEIGELTTIINSRILRKILLDRQAYLQKEVNRFVREQKLIDAYGAICRLDNIEKTMSLIQEYLDELKSQKED